MTSPTTPADDPTFATRAELAEWAFRTARDAQCHYKLGERDALFDALETIRRVTLAHLETNDE